MVMPSPLDCMLSMNLYLWAGVKIVVTPFGRSYGRRLARIPNMNIVLTENEFPIRAERNDHNIAVIIVLPLPM